MKLLQKYTADFTLVLIGCITLWLNFNMNWSERYWKGIVESDAKGYYAYLPAIFIYNDLNFGFFEATEGGKYYDEHLFCDYRANYKGQHINKFFVGTAVAQAPFFMVTHYMLVNDGDGYGKSYAYMVAAAAMFYMLLGLYLLNRTLRILSIISWQRALLLSVIYFGTNLFCYTIVEPGMSHVYSFAFVNLFVLLSVRWLTEGRHHLLLPLGLTLGMIFLIRPVNGLVIFSLPLLAVVKGKWRWNDWFQPEFWKHMTLGFLGFLVIGGIQLIIYKISTGSWWAESYPNENFDFGQMKFIDFLISYRKGLFLYTPVYFVAFLLGLTYGRARFNVFWAFFFSIVVYVLSSWWNWYYGGSFSSRVMVEYLPFFAVALALGWSALKIDWLKRTVPLVLVALTLLCQIQTYQYRVGSIHWSEMTKDEFWRVFPLTKLINLLMGA